VGLPPLPDERLKVNLTAHSEKSQVGKVGLPPPIDLLSNWEPRLTSDKSQVVGQRKLSGPTKSAKRPAYFSGEKSLGRM
jgi:hypothetical protein